MGPIKSKPHFAPAPIFMALALLLFAMILTAQVGAQKTKQLPPPPPIPRLKPKPTPRPSPTPIPEYEVVRVTSNLVVVPVSVTDARGQPVVGLRLPNFRVEEDGRAQEVAQLGDPEQVPLDIALLVDVSASVVARFSFEKEAAASFLKQVLKPEDRATIFAIDEQPRLIQELTTAQRASEKLITMRPADGYTAFFDSVLAAANYLDKTSPPGRRRIVVVISDGDDTARILNISAAQSRNGNLELIGKDAQLQLIQRALSETQREVQRAEITFYSINPSGQTMHLNVRTARSEEGMERIAAATGGAAFIPAGESDLNDIFRRIAAEIRSQYLIQYYSNNKSGAGVFRHIKVSLPSQPQLRIRAREGYYPKAK
jgi:Ca-activated chloride channel family protein